MTLRRPMRMLDRNHPRLFLPLARFLRAGISSCERDAAKLPDALRQDCEAPRDDDLRPFIL